MLGVFACTFVLPGLMHNLDRVDVTFCYFSDGLECKVALRYPCVAMPGGIT